MNYQAMLKDKRERIIRHAGHRFKSDETALIGNPSNRAVANPADGRSNAVYIHGMGENPEGVLTAISQIPLKDLLYAMPVRVKRTANGYVIVSLDADLGGLYSAGAEARQDQIPVYLSQVFYGTMHPEPPNGAMSVLCVGAMFGDKFVNDQSSADFSTNPNDVNGNPITVPTTNNRAIFVLIQVNAATGALSYKQSAEYSAETLFVPAYEEGFLPEADYDCHRYGYLRLVAGMTTIGYDKIWSLPEFLNKAPYGSLSLSGATTNATATTVGSVRVADGEYLTIRCKVQGWLDDDSEVIFGTVEGAFYRNGGNVTQVHTTTKSLSTNSGASPTADFALDTVNQEVDVQVTGVAAENWNWRVIAEIQKL